MDQNEEQEYERTERQQKNREVIKTLGEIRDIFKKNGEDFDKATLKGIDGDVPKKPSFPFIVMGMAIFKDVVDVTDLTVGGIILTTILTFLCSAVMLFWCWRKISGGIWKKAIIRWMLWGIALVFFVELIPFIKIMPANSIFILMAHYRETKIVRLFTLALEKIHKSDIMEQINRGPGA